MKDCMVLASVGLLILAIAGCDMGPKSALGFSLPDGDPDVGKTTFMELKCTACHTVSGVDFAPPVEEPEVMVALGGEVTRIKTYGELVTSIINPSHRLAKGYAIPDILSEGESKMANYNDVLTVDQLIDLVAFLQSHYQLKEYDPTYYPPYY